MANGEDTGAQVGQILLQALTQAANLRRDAQQFAEQMGAQARRDRANIYSDLFNRGLIDRDVFTKEMGLPVSAVPEEAPAVAGEKARTASLQAGTQREILGTQQDVEEKNELTPEQKQQLQKALAAGDTATALKIAAAAPPASKLARLRDELNRNSMETTGQPVDERVFQGAVAAEYGFETDPQIAKEAAEFKKASRDLGMRKLQAEVSEAEMSLEKLKKGDDLTSFQRGQLLLELGDEKRTAKRDERYQQLQRNVADRKELDDLKRKESAAEKAGGKELTNAQEKRLADLEVREKSPLNPLPDAVSLAEEKSALDDLFEYDEQIRKLVLGGVEPTKGAEEGDEDLVDEAFTEPGASAEEFDADVVIGRILSGEQEPTDEIVSQLAADLQVSEAAIRQKITKERSVGLKREAGAEQARGQESVRKRANRKRRLGLSLTPEEQEIIDQQVKRARHPR